MRLAGKHALVTGSTKGIGLAIARAFVREGARVVITARSADDCAAIAKALGPAAVPLTELPEVDYRYTMDLNLTAYFLLSQALAPDMLERRRGSIINVGSINGSVAFPQRLAYCVSKAGVNMLTKVLAIEWAARGVRVNCLAPGYVETPFIQGLAAKGILDTRKLAQRTPMGRLGTPEEIADAAVFLAGDESSFITGSVLTADGGWQAYGYL